jgi:hypothetical protein
LHDLAAGVDGQKILAFAQRLKSSTEPETHFEASRLAALSAVIAAQQQLAMSR